MPANLPSHELDNLRKDIAQRADAWILADEAEELDGASLFADIATREVALDGELSATKVMLAQVREIGMAVVETYANCKAELAGIHELDRRVAELRGACLIAENDAHGFGAHVLLSDERQTEALKQARATLQAYVDGIGDITNLREVLNTIDAALPATAIGGAR